MKPRYRYRWAGGLWQLQNEQQVSCRFPYWVSVMRYE